MSAFVPPTPRQTWLRVVIPQLMAAAGLVALLRKVTTELGGVGGPLAAAWLIAGAVVTALYAVMAVCNPDPDCRPGLPGQLRAVRWRRMFVVPAGLGVTALWLLAR